MDHHPASSASPMNGVTSIAMISVSRTGSELGAVTANVDPDNHRQIGSMVSRSEHPMSLAGVAHSVSEDSTNQTDDMSYDRDFYQYVWFRVLILLILLGIFPVAVLIFNVTSDGAVVFILGLSISSFIVLVLPLYSLCFGVWGWLSSSHLGVFTKATNPKKGAA